MEACGAVMARGELDSAAVELVRVPALGHVRVRAQDEVAVASAWQLEVEVAEQTGDPFERLDDPRLEVVDRAVVDLGPRDPEKAHGGQLARRQERGAIRNPDPHPQ